MALVDARWLRGGDRFVALGTLWEVLKREPVDSMEISIGRVEFKVRDHGNVSMLNLPGVSQYMVEEGPKP